MATKRWIFDVECYINLFLVGAKIPGTDIRRSFQISPLGDDRQRFAKWMIDEVGPMIGFNNLAYDSPMLAKLVYELMSCEPRDAAETLYAYSQFLVTRNSKYPVNVNHIRPQYDLFKINHFDNKAKMTSLKLLEFNLRLKNLQSLPFPFDHVLSKEEIWEVIAYNDNDLDATELVLEETQAEIDLRDKMSPIYGIDFSNFNSTKMGEHILMSKITAALGEDVLYNKIPTQDGGYRLKIKNTKREFINLSEVVFDYIDFNTKAFQKIREWFVSQVITETKGVFSMIPTDRLKIIEDHYAKEELKWDDKKRKFVWKSTLKGKRGTKEKFLRTLNVVYRDFRYDFGVGGIHGCIHPGVYEADQFHQIRDIDVESYYPKLSIVNEFYPAHVGPEFCPVYEGIFQERKKYPKKTHKAENLTLKLALNGSYGKSNSEYSALYDPQYTMLTTINGQLLLCKLAEELMERVPGCVMLQVNTDGLTIRCKKEYDPLVDEICEEWEKLTKLNLEHAYYSQMVIKDVNNYLAVKEDGEVKRKGAAFIYKRQPGELELHKNFSALIVPRALEAYFVDGVLPEDFIRQHDDVYDFFLRTKIDRTSRLELRDYDEEENISDSVVGQNISRYLITGKYLKNKETKRFEKTGQGKTLIKIMPPLKGKPGEREFNEQAGWLCTVVNTLPNNLNSLKQIIDYDYYVEKTYDIIEMITYQHDKQPREVSEI